MSRQRKTLVRPRPLLGKPRRQGFSLIELMVTVAILAILLAVGVPSFQDMLQRNRVSGAANDVFSAVNQARSEAIKRGVSVRFCLNTSSASWTVKEVTSGALVRGGDLDSKLTLSSSGFDTNSVSGNSCVRFRPDGLAYGESALMTAGALKLVTGSYTRLLNINVGAIHVSDS